jgi:hypothetical protein
MLVVYKVGSMENQWEKLKKGSGLVQRKVLGHPFDQIPIGLDVLNFFIIVHPFTHEDWAIGFFFQITQDEYSEHFVVKVLLIWVE